MKAYYLDSGGKETPMPMGCYGIGVGRTAAAAIEQNHDNKGILWPLPLAPFQIIILPVNFYDPQTKEVAEKAYQVLRDKKIETLLDDRDERIGVKFKDAELIGIPLQIVIGPKNLKNGKIETKKRKSGESELHDFPSVLEKIPEILKKL